MVGPGVSAALRVLVLITAVVLVSESVYGQVWLIVSASSTDCVRKNQLISAVSCDPLAL